MIGRVRRRFERGHRARTAEGLEVRAELLFVLLPMLVLGLDRTFRQHGVSELLTDEEFSFAAAVLFGQSILKYVRGAGRTGMDGARIAYGAVKMIVFGLMPSLYTMSWIVDYNTDRQPYESGKYVGAFLLGPRIPLPIVWPVVAQLVLCAACIYVFLRVSSHGGPAGADTDRGEDTPPPPPSRVESGAVSASPHDGL